jgi:hypothetical protein
MQGLFRGISVSSSLTRRIFGDLSTYELIRRENLSLSTARAKPAGSLAASAHLMISEL